jgi:hypothetical protein
MLKDLPTEGREAIRDYLFDLLREKFKEKIIVRKRNTSTTVN